MCPPAEQRGDQPAGLPTAGFVTVAWVKRYYAIPNSTLYKWIADGVFPAPVRIGPRATRFDAQDLRAFEAGLKPTKAEDKAGAK